MRRFIRHRPSPAIVISMLALLVALGGTGVAAVGVLVPKNSVGTAQVIDNSLLAKDFKAGQVGGVLGYAHVMKDGTLDKTYSKNVVVFAAKRSTDSNDERYCIGVGGPVRAHNAVVTLDYQGSGNKRVHVSTNPVFVSQDCPTSLGRTDVVVIISNDPDFAPANSFYVVLN
jgi:hypothetical protein